MVKITTISRLLASFFAVIFGLTACSTMPGHSPSTITTTSRDGAPPFPVDVTELKDAEPKYEPKCAFGNPPTYTAVGKRYYVMESATGYTKTGVASWYGTKFHGKLTSSHEPYDMLAMTAASPTLPIPTYVRVTNLENGRQVVVKVNDRGPFANDRIMDLSYAAAKKLGYTDKGTAKVRVEAITFNKSNPSSPVTLAKNDTSVKQRYLQVGAFQQMDKAERVKIKVAQLTHHSARIETINLKEKTLYRVQIGPLPDLQASSVVDQLQHEGFNNTLMVFS